MKITETPRLIIAEASLHDVAFFFELLNSPNWLEFIGDRGIKSEADAAHYIESSLIASYKKHGYGLFKMVLKTSNHPIGICGFVKRDYLDHPDIGFAILPAYERQGYTSEAAMAVLEYGKTILKLHPILGITTSENKNSCQLLRKIGLRETGTIQPQQTDPELLLFSNE